MSVQGQKTNEVACYTGQVMSNYFHLTLSKGSMKAPHVAEHRVTKQSQMGQYLFELSDGAIDTQRIRSDAGYSIPRFPKLS